MRRERNTGKILGWLAGGIALAVSLAIPGVYLAISWQAKGASVQTEAEINARLVTGIINDNPEYWQFEVNRLEDLLGKRPGSGEKESRTVFDSSGNIVAQVRDPLDAPVISRSHRLLDAGRPVGTIEIRSSIRPILRNTLLFALLGVLMGGGVFIVLQVLPMAALRRTLDLLSEEKERALVTLDAIADGVISTDSRGNVDHINPAAEEMTGWSREDAKGRPLDEVFQTPAPLAREERGAPSGPLPEKPQGIRHDILVSTGGVQRRVDDTAAPIFDRYGKPRGAVLVFRDMTERLRSEEEQIKGKKLESVGILAGGIAHDFNNFLAGILGNISLAKLDVPRDSRAWGRLEEAEKASGRARDLASKLLAFAKGGKPVRSLISVAEIVREAAQLAARGTNVRCEFHFPPDLRAAMADGGQIGQVINNLVINAVQAMSGGGVVRIRAANVATFEGEIKYVKAGEYVRIEVEDQGGGISEENLARVFDPYFTTKEKGNGLGLTTCYHIMKSHGGNIFVESNPGTGSIFRIYLPSTREPLPAERADRAETSVHGHGRVLVMDDEDMVRDVATGMLEHLGYEPILARDGAEAIEAYARANMAGRPVDLVIMDLTVPGGMGGKEAAARLRALYPDARILVSSGYSEDPVMANFREYGFVGVVGKPYRIEDLSRAIHGIAAKG